jgi:riboflavin synthase
MLPSTRIGGHLVQGHIDTTASILSLTPDGTALTLRFKPLDSSLLRYIVEKGFITIDGASLTVTSVSPTWFEVMLIEYTQSRIVTASKRVGDEVNVEVDMVAKYVEKSIAAWTSEAGVAGSTSVGQTLTKMVDKLVDERLKAKGLA